MAPFGRYRAALSCAGPAPARAIASVTQSQGGAPKARRWRRARVPELALDPGCAPYVEHSTEAGAWCGPLISSDEHPRAGEIPSAVICIACGEFCEDAGASTVKMVRRLGAKYKRDCEAQEQARAALDRAKAWGIAPERAAKMLRTPAKVREPGAEQCSLFDRGK